MRFDHYLEMLVHDAIVLQDVSPGVILDYTTHCMTEDLPKSCGIVAFPRSPKPHEVVGKFGWVEKYWIYKEVDE